MSDSAVGLADSTGWEAGDDMFAKANTRFLHLMIRATLKPKLEIEFAEYLWALLAHMARNGCPVKHLAISNECDWDHSQPGCFFTPDDHAKLFGIVGSVTLGSH